MVVLFRLLRRGLLTSSASRREFLFVKRVSSGVFTGDAAAGGAKQTFSRSLSIQPAWLLPSLGLFLSSSSEKCLSLVLVSSFLSLLPSFVRRILCHNSSLFSSRQVQCSDDDSKELLGGEPPFFFSLILFLSVFSFILFVNACHSSAVSAVKARQEQAILRVSYVASCRNSSVSSLWFLQRRRSRRLCFSSFFSPSSSHSDWGRPRVVGWRSSISFSRLFRSVYLPLFHLSLVVYLFQPFPFAIPSNVPSIGSLAYSCAFAGGRGFFFSGH